eukprot:CAMPEP_0201567820 /NCGR_PEP_ID=MMETSP0190_2-20130828/8484_1 /ASSEMBLY_ACC=CAM_ASM_000263 /TAXON_ID=37353 /ORGANISM="Rosalina sp." /LENGTH=374 /DNA_ID=CAMNT_0047988235 /DNA_START=93 /DNA_END=1220 /DNA_ORIENTATION=+
MAYQLLTALVMLSPLIKSQPGGGGMGGGGDDTGTTTTSTKCNVAGTSSTYSEYISGDVRIIQASGCANHETICIGKPVCPANDTEAVVYDKNITIPAVPCFNNYNDTSEYEWEGFPVYCLLNSLGIALNGVSFFSPSANTECKDAMGEESNSFDTCGGHAGPTGLYHYHAGPACLIDQLNDSMTVNPNGHSPQIGWAYDGFPVYGAHGLNGEYIEKCSQNTSNSSDCLDNCGGHMQHTIDGFKYHYHIAGPNGDLESSPMYPVPTTSAYPYTFGCFKGIPADWDLIATNNVPDLSCTESGVVDGYEPIAVDGVTELYVGPWQLQTPAPTTTQEEGSSAPTESPVEIQTTDEKSSVGTYGLLFVSLLSVVIITFH